jgi:hypothetical protein
VPFYTLEVSENESEFTTLVMRVWEKLVNTDDNGLLSPDKEYVVDDGAVKIGRYQPFVVEKELSESRVAKSVSSVHSLHISAAGQLDALQWVCEPLEPEIGSGDVLLDTHAIGLNFKVS